MKTVEIPVPGYEIVVRAEDPQRGFEAIIAVHNTTLGPALGGLRMWKYPGGMEEAQVDVLRLARGMTYKSAVARTGLGGGKAVIVGDARSEKCEELFSWMGCFIDSLGGKYITAEDVGIDVLDLDVIAKETRFVTGRSREVGGSGDPSPYTALGAFCAMQEAAQEVWKSDELQGRVVAVQGLGHVGYWLAKQLFEAGARLLVADVVESRVERACDEFGATALTVDEIAASDCDVFAPCALGAVLDDDSIAAMRAKVVCGAANNQLRAPVHADQLMQRGILYAPDYVVNAGGIINISEELSPNGYDEGRAVKRVRAIRSSLREVFDYAREHDLTTAAAADRVAERVLAGGEQRAAENGGPA